MRAATMVMVLAIGPACGPREPRVPVSRGRSAAAPVDAGGTPIDAAPLDAAPPEVAPLAPDPPLPVSGTPCERACLRAYTCSARNEMPIHAHCLVTCDGGRGAELERLAAGSCADVAAQLAAGGAPIQHRTCAELVAARGGAPVPARRAALMAHPWCAPGGGPLERGPLHFEERALLWGTTRQACWTVDARRLWWTADGVSWASAALRTSARLLTAGTQRLAPCPEPPPEPPRELDQDTSRIR